MKLLRLRGFESSSLRNGSSAKKLCKASLFGKGCSKVSGLGNTRVKLFASVLSEVKIFQNLREREREEPTFLSLSLLSAKPTPPAADACVVERMDELNDCRGYDVTFPFSVP